MDIAITIQEQTLDVTRETALLQGERRTTGAIVTFIGLVRDVNEGSAVSGLMLEHYPGMAEKQIETIVTEAGRRWSLQALRVVHRVGALRPADTIVFVGVASQHRGDAFAACEYIMDHLKSRVAFWKKEQSAAGERWLETRASDDKALQKWQQ